MVRKTSKSASKDVQRAMHERKRGTLKSGRSGKTVKSRKQAIAIGLSEARHKGKRVPPKNEAPLEEIVTESWQAIGNGTMRYVLGIGLAGAAIGLMSAWAAKEAGRWMPTIRH